MHSDRQLGGVMALYEHSSSQASIVSATRLKTPAVTPCYNSLFIY